MTHDEFVQEYKAILTRALTRALACAEKAGREGLLAVEEELDPEKVRARDVFEYDLRFVVDGTDAEVVGKILSNIAAQEKDEYRRVLKTLQKEAVLMILEGTSLRPLAALLNSCFDRALADGAGALRPYPDYTGYCARSVDGWKYFDQKNYDRAIVEYTEAIRLNPNYAREYTAYGDAYRGKRDYDRAIADFNEAIRIDPSN